MAEPKAAPTSPPEFALVQAVKKANPETSDKTMIISEILLMDEILLL
jgi:hypothetical protein